jgi:predicted aldo/keto reductase-like oxidoreductase
VEVTVKYRQFGNTGCNVSALGFGCMRFPMKDATTVDRDKAIPMLLRAYELGVNYFDTGKWYCGQDSERTLGEALKHMDRSRVYVSTKYAMEKPTGKDLRQKFEASLKLLDLPSVDFYHLWGISWAEYETKLAIPGGPLEEFLKLKREGLARHLAFSFHSKPEDIRKIVDTGHFESMLCQYNLLDRANADGIAYAAAKGLGVVIMGPVGGGRLGAPSGVIGKMLGNRRPVSSPELALRFVLSTPGVSIALSGMSEMKHVEENVEVASRESWLTEAETRNVLLAAEENRKFMDLYCTGCKYCMPCPHEVNIPRIFEAMNLQRVWGLTESAKSMYRAIGSDKWNPGKQADACQECGECEPKCPQKIPIISQLKECHEALKD